MNYKEYIQKYKEVKDSPAELTDFYYSLAGFYGFISQEYSELIPKIAQTKKELLEKFEKISEVNRRYEISEVGQLEDKIKIELKGIEKMLPAIKRKLTTFDNESHNQY